MDAFRTLAAEASSELEVKGSRFLAIAAPVADRAAAELFIGRQARAHRNPTHIVPAWRLRDGTAYSSDAGEPAGSAGAPLLAALEGAGVHDVAAVVVRWYGGVNLGVGGLVRAYGAALAGALAAARTVERVRAVSLEVRYGHELTAAVLRTIHAHGGHEIAYAYGAQVSCRFALPASRLEAFELALRDATRGAIAARISRS